MANKVATKLNPGRRRKKLENIEGSITLSRTRILLAQFT
jgi:hypothetical protein